MRRVLVSGIVLAALAFAGPAPAAVHYTCPELDHGGYRAYELSSTGIDCGTFTGFAKRIIDHGTGFLVAAKWTCHEAKSHTGHGYVDCVRDQYVALRFHFRPV